MDSQGHWFDLFSHISLFPAFRSIGVSNFSIEDLEELLKTAKVIPAVNQVGIFKIGGDIWQSSY